MHVIAAQRCALLLPKTITVRRLPAVMSQSADKEPFKTLELSLEGQREFVQNLKQG